MSIATYPSLESALEALSRPGIAIGHRIIVAGDEEELLPAEAPAFASSVVKVRRASGAARMVARGLLGSLGYSGWPIVKAPSGQPIWPSGVVGSLAHDARCAVAAVARAGDIKALGIDVEPAEMLPADVLHLVATPRELARLDQDPFGGRLLFVAKEAVYKAVYPLDQVFLDHHDVEVDFDLCKAHVRGGRVVDLRFAVSTHLLGLAFIAAAP